MAVMFPSVLIESLSVRHWHVTSVRGSDSFTCDVSRHVQTSEHQMFLQILILPPPMTATVKVFKQCIVKDWQCESKTNILIFLKVALRFALST